MSTNASPALIAALRASLANTAHGWVVIGASESSSTRLSEVSVTGSVSGSTTGSTSGSITGGEGEVTGSVSGSVAGSTSSTNASITTDTLTVTLLAQHLLAPGGTQLQLTYISTKINGTFTSAKIKQAGSDLVSTDTALDATMRGLAAAYQAARDAELATLFASTGSGSGSGGGGQAGGTGNAAGGAATTASAQMIANLKLSLADPNAKWAVQGGTTNVIKEPKQGAADEPLQMVVVRIDRQVTLGSPLVRVAINAWAPLVFAYTGSTNAQGVYQSGILYMDGKAYDVNDTALDAQIMALAATAWADGNAHLIESLAFGPQTNAQIEAALAAGAS